MAYSPVTEEELATNIPISFMAMSKIWQAHVAPLLESDRDESPNAKGPSTNAPSPVTIQ